jgi:hypothetical protein
MPCEVQTVNKIIELLLKSEEKLLRHYLELAGAKILRQSTDSPLNLMGKFKTASHTRVLFDASTTA